MSSWQTRFSKKLPQNSILHMTLAHIFPAFKADKGHFISLHYFMSSDGFERCKPASTQPKYCQLSTTHLNTSVWP